MNRGRLALVCGALLLVAAAPLVGGLPSGEQGAFVLWQLRVPRVLVGFEVGAVLAVAGATFQTLFDNPLATPDTVGTTAGATLGALAALVLAQGHGSAPLLVLAAFAGALLISALTASFAARGDVGKSDVLLAGIAFTLAAGAISTGLEYGADVRAVFMAAQWSLGHLPQVGYRGALVIAPFALLSVGVQLALVRPLHSLSGGEDLAHAQGVDVRVLRTLCLGFGSLGVAAAVAWCGPIAFVGLIVPNLVRRVVGGAPRALLPSSLLVGGAFLVGCDALARLVWPGAELPVGVVTAALGAPALVALIARRRPR